MTNRTLTCVVTLLTLAPGAASLAQTPVAQAEVTFTRDIAPILQRSCQTCHRPDSVAPMAPVSYTHLTLPTNREV